MMDLISFNGSTLIPLNHECEVVTRNGDSLHSTILEALNNSEAVCIGFKYVGCEYVVPIRQVVIRMERQL